MRSIDVKIEKLHGLVAGVTRVVVQERHHLRHLLLLQLAGPAPRAEARPALVHGAGRRLLRVPGVQCLHRNTVYCTVLYCTVLYRCPSTSTSTPSLSTSPPCCSASEAPLSGLPRSAPTVISAVTVITPCCGQGTFLTRNSDSVTITRNSGIFWAILKTSGLIGNMAAFFLFQDQETLQRRTWVLLGAVLTSVSGLGTVLLLLLRKCSPEL